MTEWRHIPTLHVVSCAILPPLVPVAPARLVSLLPFSSVLPSPTVLFLPAVPASNLSHTDSMHVAKMRMQKQLDAITRAHKFHLVGHFSITSLFKMQH